MLKNKLKLQVDSNSNKIQIFFFFIYNVIKREKFLINLLFCTKNDSNYIFFRTLLCNCLVSLEIGFLWFGQSYSKYMYFTRDIYIYIYSSLLLNSLLRLNVTSLLQIYNRSSHYVHQTHLKNIILSYFIFENKYSQ